MTEESTDDTDESEEQTEDRILGVPERSRSSDKVVFEDEPLGSDDEDGEESDE